jgi:AraC family transcriptional regulator
MGSRVSLAEVAAVAGLSLAHFASGFKEATGVAPCAWLRRRRMERAKELLRDRDVDLTTIANMLGYANQSAFGVALRREIGVTPTEWRRQLFD